MDFPGKNTGVGFHFLLQGIFLIQGSNPCLWHLLHWLADSLPPCRLGSPSHFRGCCQVLTCLLTPPAPVSPSRQCSGPHPLSVCPSPALPRPHCLSTHCGLCWSKPPLSPHTYHPGSKNSTFRFSAKTPSSQSVLDPIGQTRDPCLHS